MTYEEAIKVIESNRPTAGYTMLCEALDIAKEALEKQILVKPNNITVEKYKVSYDCPKCGTKHINEWCGTEWKLPFCSICGQALQWSDTE